jgi:hypothetical protein
MKSFLDYIADLPETEWNYYAGFSNNTLLRKPFVTDNSPLEFIRQYIDKGGKKEVLTHFDIDRFDLVRANHIASLFFFGILVYESTDFKGALFFNAPPELRYDLFQFLWFLTCLYHDASYHLEKDPTVLEKFPTIESLNTGYDIKYRLLDQKVERVSQSLLEKVLDYYEYRHKIRKSTDHGIFAGILMYDGLVKNRIIQKAKPENDLYWEPILDQQYAYVSATVATHNIWLPKEKDYALYEEHNLKELIKHEKVTFSESPMLYFLGIIDTIEPVKAYEGKDPLMVLRHVHFSFPDRQIMKIKIDGELDPQCLIQRGMALCSWLDTGFTAETDGITIVFNLPAGAVKSF